MSDKLKLVSLYVEESSAPTALKYTIRFEENDALKEFVVKARVDDLIYILEDEDRYDIVDLIDEQLVMEDFIHCDNGLWKYIKYIKVNDEVKCYYIIESSFTDEYNNYIPHYSLESINLDTAKKIKQKQIIKMKSDLKNQVIQMRRLENLC